MDDCAHIKLYLAQAKQADDRAQQATDLLVKEGWRKVAAAYRDLAARHAARVSNWQ